ncbi:MAG TPA: hypothetical protein VGM77_01155 [Gemmatimonadales bacterium]|jgi:hypothetical protein
MSSPLGSDLGRLGQPSHGRPFDDVRLALIDHVLAAKARDELTQRAWEDAFADAARSLRVRIVAGADQALRAAALHSRFPARRLARLLPGATAADTLLNKMLAAGMPLEQLAGLPDDDASRRLRAAALDSAWTGAEQVATTEQSRWRAVASDVAAWRRAPAPIWVASVTLVFAALFLAAWFSGEVSSPAWFAPINAAWWRLWP